MGDQLTSHFPNGSRILPPWHPCPETDQGSLTEQVVEPELEALDLKQVIRVSFLFLYKTRVSVQL
jgi:hypothetical protein